jgi:hypothetical protein
MKTETIATGGLELLGLMMIGEGVVGAIFPSRYSLFWKLGPRWMHETARAFANHPETTRLLCLAEAAAGLWIAARLLDRP